MNEKLFLFLFLCVLFGTLAWLLLGAPGLRRRPRVKPGVKRVRPEPVRCAYCGGDKFYEGPQGGVCVNILCANDDCRHWFNYSGGLLPLEDLKRVEPRRP